MSELRTIQAARAIAANLVVFSHLFFVEAKYTASGILPAFTLYGIAGVDLFFVISGFIMVAVAGRDRGPIEFLWRRATRIYPTYWLVSLMVLATTLIAPTFVNSSITTPISLWRSFLLVPDRTFPLLAVGWTLVYEMYFYLAFAIFLALRISVFVGLIAWGVLILIIAAAFPDQIASSPVLRVVVSPLTAEFMMGAFVGMLWRRRCVPGALAVGAVGLAGLIVSIVYIAPMLSLAANPYLDAWRVIIFGIPVALIVYALTGLEQLYPSGRPAKLLVALGDWSYATYLIHVLIISAIGRTIFALAPGGGVGASFALIATGVLAANVAGGGSHALFERPTLNWLRKFGARLKTREIHARVPETNDHTTTPQRS
jgi:exopolysaccharide production protein ExoZ